MYIMQHHYFIPMNQNYYELSPSIRLAAEYVVGKHILEISHLKDYFLYSQKEILKLINSNEVLIELYVPSPNLIATQFGNNYAYFGEEMDNELRNEYMKLLYRNPNPTDEITAVSTIRMLDEMTDTLTNVGKLFFLNYESSEIENKAQEILETIYNDYIIPLVESLDNITKILNADFNKISSR